MTTLVKATNIDILSGLLLEESLENQVNVDLLNHVAESIAAVDFDSESTINEAQTGIIALIESSELTLTVDENINAIELVNGFAGSLVSSKTNANRLRLATRRCLQDMAVYLDTLPLDTGKVVADSIGRSQKHIIASLTPTSILPEWVWLDGNEVKSYRIAYSATKKSILCAERKEKGLQVDILGALRAEKQAHTLLCNCIADESDGETWVAAVQVAIDTALTTKTKNQSILSKIDELKPRIEAANWRSYRTMTIDGFKGFSQNKFELAESLLEKCGSLATSEAKTGLIHAVSAFHQSEHARKERLDLDQTQAKAILARLEVTDVYEALREYDQLKPKYGALLTAYDELKSESTAQTALIAELKQQLIAATKPKAAKAA